MKLHAAIDDRTRDIELGRDGSRLKLTLDDGSEVEADVVALRPGRWSLLIGTRVYDLPVEPAGEGRFAVWLQGLRRTVAIRDPRRFVRDPSALGGDGPSVVTAAMPGKVVEVLVHEGDEVQTGQGLLVVEAMKMQNEIKSPRPGRVASIAVAAGGSVNPGAALITIE